MIKITYFVHGTTIDNEQNKATGWLPGELSELGVKQAKELPQQIVESDFDVVFCSDLKRAIDSAKLGFGDTHEIMVDERLREANYGDYDGLDKSFKQNMTQFIDTPYPNGESYHDVEKRIGDFLEFLKLEHPGRHIAIVAHEAPQLALEVLLNGRTWQQAIDENWREVGKWQPGWVYEVEEL